MKPRYIVAIDYGNGLIKYRVIEAETGKLIKEGFFPSLILPLSSPGDWVDYCSMVNDQVFAYGNVAANMNLKASHSPGKGGGLAAKSLNLQYVLAAVLVESGLVALDDKEPVAIQLRLATPLNRQAKSHQDLVGELKVDSPKRLGGQCKAFMILEAVSFQECRAVIKSKGVDGGVDLGGGTSFYGYRQSSGHIYIENYELGVLDLLKEAVSSPLASERFEQAAAAVESKGTMSPQGLAQALATGKAFKGGGCTYKGVEFKDILEPLLLAYWNDVVLEAIRMAATNAVSMEPTKTILVFGGGAALLKKLVSSDVLDDHGVHPDVAKVVWLKKPQLELVKAMAEIEHPVVE